VLPATDEQRLESEATNEGRHRFWLVSGPAAGGTFAFRLKTNLRGESAEAARRMSAALALHNDGKWGDFMREAERALAEFPFASKTTQRRLADRIGEVTRSYVALAKEAGAMLADYEEFRDLQSLDRVQAILHEWRTRFQVKPGEGQRGKEYEGIAKKERELRNAALSKAQSRRAAGFFEQAKYLHMASGEDYSAAVMFTYIAEWLPFAEQVGEARTELDTISKQKPQVLKVLKALGLRR
jgi:hypothetical protein